MMQVVEELSNLRLDILDDDWAQGIYYSEFLEFGEFPAEYQSILDSLEIRSVFKNIMRAINNWLCEETDEEKSWAGLSQHVQSQKLLAILAYFIDYGTKNVLEKENRNNALLASRLYYKFLSVSGFKAYHIYHSQLFAQSLACLGYPKAMCDNEDNYYNTQELTRQVNSVIKELKYFVYNLRTIMESLQLNPSDMNFEDILSNLVDITGGAIVNKLNVDKIELVNITMVIYELIDILLYDVDGEPNAEAILLLFKCVLPKLVAASVDCRNANNLVRASYVTYSGLLLHKYGKPALSGYTVLLQHLCYTQDGLERAEVRQARVSLVVGMMSLLPRKSYRIIVTWLLALSTTAKISHRQIALEILAKLLSNDPEELPQHNVPPRERAVNLVRIKREPNLGTEEQSSTGEQPSTGEQSTGEQPSTDEQSSTGEQLSAGEQPSTEEQSSTGEQPSTGEEPNEAVEGDQSTDTLNRSQPDPDASRVPPANEDESSQDSQIVMVNQLDVEVTEEDIAGMLRQRPHTVPHAEILRALYERVNDVSSTLRARALQLLTECLHSDRAPMQQALQELNGSGPVSRLMAVAARCVCDERAAVRRAAVSLVHRSLTAPRATPPADTDLGILVGLCRDASILVRSAAIGALGELALHLPSAPVCAAFLSGPMHQLSDPETKVQEQVVALVRQVLVDRLQKYAAEGEDALPWLLLAEVARHNMRRHLQKACALLTKTANCISPRLVDILSTHLGAADDARDLQCLVLLTSVARHVDYGDIHFALDYYYKLAEDTNPRDVRLMPLTLELLTAWTRWARAEERTALRDHLVRGLADNYHDGCRLARATLAAHLGPGDLQWATELMQLSEKRAVSGVDVEEWTRAADLSLVAPAPPSAALYALFPAALTDPPAEWSTESRGISVAGCGRLCLRSREAAAAAAPPLAALLQNAAAPLPARVNALLALADICTRYTCIVEPLLGCVCGCLEPRADSSLRRAAARALTRLLLAGYLRLRTPLYYRYCALLADEDPDVREPAEYYVTSCLTADSIYHHFVDCVLHYNEESENISFDARQLIYDVMLQRLSVVQRLNLQCRLAREVLEHAADVTDEGDGELPPALSAALLDTITLLCGPRMKLPKKPPRDGEAADIDDLQERVTSNIVSHKMKRTVAEVLVPAVLRLYSRVRAGGGQVAAYLVRIATDLFNDYQQEIEEVIENDDDLVERVRQFQETIGLEPSFGNARNLVTASTTHEVETPRAPRRRANRAARSPPRKRALRV